jgi:phosphoenolpyruvate synthase/pyruvate phosphate dikinase
VNDSRYIVPLKRRSPSELLGIKAASLRYLRKHKYNIPETWIIPTTLWDEFRNNRIPVLKKLESELGLFDKGDYAIRSSSSVEDHADSLRYIQDQEKVWKAC